MRPHIGWNGPRSSVSGTGDERTNDPRPLRATQGHSGPLTANRRSATEGWFEGAANRIESNRIEPTGIDVHFPFMIAFM